MRKILITAGLSVLAASAVTAANAGDAAKKMIKSALSAAPASITNGATIMDPDGNVLREGENGWTCFPQQPAMGPMCNSGEWGAMISALMGQEEFTPSQISISYMLAGEGDAIGVSNIDPYATEPTDENDWIKEGPHLMIIVPDQAMLEGMSTDPNDPVYVMWKGTPYAHIMVRISEEE